ncbi:MAG TPA: maltose alpha-D-glucosyltransferase [Acetobacteraceae bacterium]|jgi:maltose alpha-D-glucosyltransferase/alpha-amylase
MNIALARPRPAPAQMTEDKLWYKDAVIYQLHVKSFFDSNNDGVGDFPGLLAKLDYIAELGVNAIWLLPFYPSPLLDDGYDIADYRGVHPDYGNLADVKRFIHEAHRRGMRVITELVVNHTSIQHPWFQRARHAKSDSTYRNFYVWSDTDQKYAGTRVIFVDTERSNWTWDPIANAYYWHRFYSHQPDLNFDNPRVLKEVLAVLRFWADLGVDGLRLDAVPYLVEREGTNNENLAETHAVLKQIRAELETHYPDRMLLAEANQWPEDTKEYFGEGDGDECHMAFHFPLMPRMYMAIAREDRFPITDIMRQTPDIPSTAQWAIFLRNHDELTLEMVTQSERDFLWETYAADRRARLNLGIRRRLAPLLEHDRRRIELMNNLLLSMPGTPVIYYGDEIGMGDNVYLGDRNGVRTPMQWSPDRNGGFSRADPKRLVSPPIMDPLYGYEAVNVEAQAADPHSLLMWMRRTIAVRRQYQAFGRGTFRPLYPKNRKILAYLREHESTVILCVANLARTPQAVELDLSEFENRIPIELDGGSVFPPIGKLTYLLTLAPYGFYWFNLAEETAWPSLHTPAPEPMPEYQTVVWRKNFAEGLLAMRHVMEHEVLPPYLAKRRWFAQKDQTLTAVRIALAISQAQGEMALVEIETETPSGTARWLLPLGIAWEDGPPNALAAQLALARVRRGARVGLLTDAFALPELARGVMNGLAQARTAKTEAGDVCFEPTSRMREIAIPPDVDLNWLSAEQSNSSLIVGDIAMLKLFRRVSSGQHPEAEMGRYLTEQGFASAPPLLGEVVRVDTDGTRHTLAIVQGFIRNQGDAWSWTLDLLMRGLSDMSGGDDAAAADAESHEDYDVIATLLGRRLGEMHAVLARPSDNPDFAPEVAEAPITRAWATQAAHQIDAAFAALNARQDWPDDTAQDLENVLALRDRLAGTVKHLASQGVGSPVTRIHGDLHLGQVLVANGDVYIIDFEGEPAKPLEQRRAKNSAARDVAGMIRSFDYAAAVVDRKSRESHAHLPEPRRAAFLESFVARATESFLAGYREAAGPVDQALLDLFLLEKAAYEIVYEAANRPTWIDVPLRGLARVAESLLHAEAAS